MKLRPVLHALSTTTCVLLVPFFAALAVSMPTAGTSGSPIYDFFIGSVVQGPIGLLAGILALACAACCVVCGKWAQAVPCLFGGFLLVKLTTVMNLFGALLP